MITFGRLILFRFILFLHVTSISTCSYITTLLYAQIGITVRVIVVDYNDNPPVFDQVHHETSIPEVSVMKQLVVLILFED